MNIERIKERIAPFTPFIVGILIIALCVIFQKPPKRMGHVIDVYGKDGKCHYILLSGKDTIDYIGQCCKYGYMDTVILTK